MDVIDELARNRIVPVVVIDDPAHAEPLAAALIAGGIRCAEITLRTTAGLESIRRLADRRDFLVGAGTVLLAGHVDAAVDAGARFLVSPGLGADVIERAQDLDTLAIPGIATATELQRAAGLGLRAVKCFPIEQLGGPALISALAGPFPGMRFMPSGGVTGTNIAGYADHPSVFAVGASWFVSRGAVARGDFDAITRGAAEALERVRAVA